MPGTAILTWTTRRLRNAHEPSLVTRALPGPLARALEGQAGGDVHPVGAGEAAEPARPVLGQVNENVVAVVSGADAHPGQARPGAPSLTTEVQFRDALGRA
jgi:hypothetical protein